MKYYVGQAFGMIATIASIVLPLYKKKWQMLVIAAAINLLMALNFILIGEVGPGAFLCVVATVQCLVTLDHTVKNKAVTKNEKIIFLMLYIGVGLMGFLAKTGFFTEFTPRHLVELLPIAGSVLGMIFVFTREEQRARYFLLLTCCIWALYAALIRSTAFFAQFVSIIIAVWAMYQYRSGQPAPEKKKK